MGLIGKDLRDGGDFCLIWVIEIGLVEDSNFASRRQQGQSKKE
jgi:hypothetical protein